MSKSRNQSEKYGRVVIRGVRRKRPDASKIARAVIGLALREAALEAEAQRTTTPETPSASEAQRKPGERRA